ncbi:MAG TPA: hypothetical protein VHF88_07400 [Thermoleophilaceae bacterium]|nr:hypothetical protein [Thermoleophilaceae bacterium]
MGFGIADAVGAAWPGTSSAAWWAGTCDLDEASTSGVGVGTPPASFAHCIDHGTPYDPVGETPTPPRETTWQPGGEPSWRLDPVAQAGAHPDATASFWLQRSPHPALYGSAPVTLQGEGEARTVKVSLPPGVVGDPNAVPRCPSKAMQTTPTTCPPETQVGVATVTLVQTGTPPYMQSLYPVYNAEPRDGKTAELIVSVATNNAKANIPIVARARTEGDFGVDGLAVDLPGGIPVLGQTITLWGVPWASSHDKFRPRAGYAGHQYAGGSAGGMPETGLTNSDPTQEPQSYDPSWGPIRPFFTNPTECAPAPPVTELGIASWQDPDRMLTYPAFADALVARCGAVPFDADIDVRPTTTAADAPTGIEADLRIPQNNDPPAAVATNPDDATGAPAHWESDAGLGTAQLDRAVVTLPRGVSVNPSGAAGLEGCSDAQIGLTRNGNPPLFNNEDPFDGRGAECPDGSKIGTVDVYTPLLPAAYGEVPGTPNLRGEVVLGMPRSTDPTSGDMFRMFVVVRNVKRGLVAKVFGSAVADPATGQLTATFDRNPRVPFETMQLRFKGGDRGLVATPQRCATHGWATTLTPWTAAHGGGGASVADGGAFTTNANCGYGFSPALAAGMSERRGRANGTFSLTVARADGQQWLAGLSAEMPTGLLANVGDVPLCGDAQANAGACPIASRIGTVDAAAGAGSPFVLERKGDVYLTEGYKGAPYGLATVVPVEAGPFRGRFALTPVVVRQALHVDRTDASVTAVSDPFPQIWHGIPLRVRRVTISIDRPGFMLNPSDCSPKAVAATIASSEGAAATPAVPFQAIGCGSLRFKPRLGMRLTGKRQRVTGRHPGVRAVVRQRAGEAGIERAVVRLPKSLALDPDNARALCEFEDGTKPDLERHCPKGSIVGRARAISPLLRRPLVGNVYFVKNVRIDRDTGNEIRTLPMIVVALRGEIAVNLRGESSVRGKRLVNTFAGVPDAPVSRFNLNIRGGRNGILAVTRTRKARINLCSARRQIAEADMDGHNGRRHDRNVRIKVPCPKRRATGKRRR